MIVILDRPVREDEVIRAIQTEPNKRPSVEVSKVVEAKFVPEEPVVQSEILDFMIFGYSGSRPSAPEPKPIPENYHFRYVQGYSNGTFQPEGNITRAEVAMIFARLSVEGMNVPNA